MNAATNRTIQCTITAIVFGCLAAFSWSAVAHPLGQGNCLPRYHEWRDATFELRDARADLEDYTENLAAAKAAGDWMAALRWTIAIASKGLQIASIEARIPGLLQRFQACDHY